MQKKNSPLNITAFYINIIYFIHFYIYWLSLWLRARTETGNACWDAFRFRLAWDPVEGADEDGVDEEGVDEEGVNEEGMEKDVAWEEFEGDEGIVGCWCCVEGCEEEIAEDASGWQLIKKYVKISNIMGKIFN